jgi:hypothetical protein
MSGRNRCRIAGLFQGARGERKELLGAFERRLASELQQGGAIVPTPHDVIGITWHIDEADAGIAAGTSVRDGRTWRGL